MDSRAIYQVAKKCNVFAVFGSNHRIHTNNTEYELVCQFIRLSL